MQHADDSPLVVNAVTTGYGALPVLSDMSLNLRTGEIVAVLGANGAGKTTLLRCIAGLLPIWTGSITYFGQVLNGRKVPEIARLGVGVVFGRDIFGTLSPTDNLAVAAVRSRAQERERRTRMDQLLELFPDLAAAGSRPAGTLSGGQQQMLALAMTLMADPKVVLLDEPSMGLAPQAVTAFFEVLRQVPMFGTSVLLVEQNAAEALELADRAYVIEQGHVTLEGTAEVIKGDDRIRSAYLGI